MKNFVLFLLSVSVLAFTSCRLLGGNDNESRGKEDGWFEIPVTLVTKENNDTIRDIYFLNRDVGWIVGRTAAEVGYKAYIGFTENGGKDWDFDYPGEGTEFQSVYFLNREQGVFSDYGIYFTQNRIRSYKRIINYSYSRIDHLNFGSSSNGWGVGLAGTVARTTNGGKNWHYLDLDYGDQQRFVSVAAIGDQEAWLLMSTNILLHTTNGGSTWEKINLTNAVKATPVRYQDITFTDAKNGWIVGDFRRILHTKDGGQTWMLQYPKTEDQRSFDSIMCISAYDSLNAIAGTSHGGMLRTKDGGQTWHEQLPAKDEGGSFHSVQFVDSTVAYAAGGSTLMKTITGGKKDDKTKKIKSNL